MMWKLKPEETVLVGMWLDGGTRVMNDAVADRIEWLTEHVLVCLAEGSQDGGILYRDPADGRLWEKVYPFEGAPPRMRVIDEEEARSRYGQGA